MKLRITTLDDDGAGWGVSGEERVRVSGAFPGDEVEAEPFHFAKQRRFHDARLTTLITPSADRAPLPCPIWRDECACPIMPLSARAQAAFKHARVEAAFPRERFPALNVEPVREAALREHYRSKVVLVCVREGNGVRVGGYARGSHRVLDLRGCVIEAPLLREVADWFRSSRSRLVLNSQELRYVALRANASEALVTLIGPHAAAPWASDLAEQLRRDIPAVRGVSWSINDSPGNAIWVAGAKTLSGAETISEDVSGASLQLSPSSFFQVHRTQAAALRNEMVAALAGPRVAWDLFCGIGVNAIALATQGASVVGIEAHEAAVLDATANAQRLGLDARFLVSSLDAPAAQLFAALPRPDAVVLNPTRKGASLALIAAVVAAQPQRIAYVACAPAPLTSAAALMYENGYIAERVVPFDLFPHTPHVETLAIFKRA